MSALIPTGSLQHSTPSSSIARSDSPLTERPQTLRPSRVAPNIDRSRIDPQLREAADGMEAMFLDYMMKVMRQTVPKGELEENSAATEIYQGMLDSEIAQKAARTGGVGLSDQIIAYLQSQRYTGSQGAAPGMNPQAAAHRYQASTKSSSGVNE